MKQQFSALKNLPQFFRLVWQTSPRLTFANAFMRLLKAVLPLLQLYLGKLIIDEVIRLIGVEGERDLSDLWLYVGLEAALVILGDVLSRAINLVDSLLGDLFANATSVQLIEHSARLDLYKFEDPAFYDKLERARRQTVGRVTLMSQVFSQAQDIISIVALGAGLVTFNFWLIGLLAIAVLPSFFSESYFNQQTYSLSRNWTPQRRELDYLRYIGASNETAKEVKSFGLSAFLTKRFSKVADAYYVANRKLSVNRAAWGSLLGLLSSLAYYGAYVFILLQAVSGLITVGTLTFLVGSFEKLQSQLQASISRFTSIAQSALYLSDLFDFLAMQPDVQPSASHRKVPRPIQRGFTFEDVGFRYFNSEKWSLRHVSFHLKAGEKLALVGENGAGKTTLVKLLSRLYEPTEGRILLDGVDLREHDLADLRRAVGVIFQDYVRFQLSVAENIAVGQIDRLPDRPLIEGAAVKSLAEPVINLLPLRYEQMLGRRFSKGVELSGGEWHKIALARAYMRDAQLLILDEPTAALDARAEHEVFLRFSELIEGRSAVLISHRFSTVRMADRILFLEKGEMRELGSHEELLKQGGKYAELFELQARGYV